MFALERTSFARSICFPYRPFNIIQKKELSMAREQIIKKCSLDLIRRLPTDPLYIINTPHGTDIKKLFSTLLKFLPEGMSVYVERDADFWRIHENSLYLYNEMVVSFDPSDKYIDDPEFDWIGISFGDNQKLLDSAPKLINTGEYQNVFFTSKKNYEKTYCALNNSDGFYLTIAVDFLDILLVRGHDGVELELFVAPNSDYEKKLLNTFPLV